MKGIFQLKNLETHRQDNYHQIRKWKSLKRHGHLEMVLLLAKI